MINASGNNRKNYLRVIKQGLKIKELTKPIKYKKINNIWSIYGEKNENNDQEIVKMIALSTDSETIVLTYTNNSFAQTKDTGIDNSTKSLFINRMDDGSLIQITENGFKHIIPGRVQKLNAFDGKIIKGVAKGMQMVLALLGGEIFYYEMDQTG